MAETITLLLIFSVIVTTFIMMYGQNLKGREDLILYEQAIMLARTEMEKQELVIHPVKKVVSNYYTVEIYAQDYSLRIKEVQVIVKWQDSKGKEKQIELKRLIYLRI